MKLVILYGLPASGKLTIGKHLAKMTGYKLFHNHLINDVVKEIINFNHPSFWDISEKLKLLTIKLAAKYKVKGVIFTIVYTGERKFIQNMRRAVKSQGGEVYTIKLETNPKELCKRIDAPSRKKFAKLTSKSKLRKFMGEHDVYATIPFKNQLVIDNSKIPAKKVAEIIVKEFKLK